MFKTVTIRLFPAGEQSPVDVGGVLVGQPSTEETVEAMNLFGKKVTYWLALPKGDANEWADAYVTLPEPFSGVYRTVGWPVAGIEENIPLRWNKKVRLEAIQALHAPHTVTVYNVREDPATFEQSVTVTILSGVNLEGGHGADAGEPGMRPTGSATLLIPLTIKGTDPNTGAERVYAGAREYAAAADRSGLWTLDPNSDFFVKGEVVDPSGSFQMMKSSRDDVYRVRSVKRKDAGPQELWCLEVEGA